MTNFILSSFNLWNVPGSQIVTLEKTTPIDTGVSFFRNDRIVSCRNRYRFSEITVSFRVEIGIVFEISQKAYRFETSEKRYSTVSFGIVWYRFYRYRSVSFLDRIVWYRFVSFLLKTKTQRVSRKNPTSAVSLCFHSNNTRRTNANNILFLSTNLTQGCPCWKLEHLHPSISVPYSTVSECTVFTFSYTVFVLHYNVTLSVLLTCSQHWALFVLCEQWIL